MKRTIFPILLSLSAFLLAACSQRPKEITPDLKFANYITAYTGGLISPNSSIRIELAQPQPSVQINSQIAEKLFDFKPSLKGNAYWIDNRSIEFIPDEGQLQQGKLYQAEFKLGKIKQVDSGLQSFAFSFRVERQGFHFETEPCLITEANPNSVTVKGQIRFNTPVEAEEVHKLFSSNFSKVETKVEPTPNPTIFSILFEDIPRTNREQTLIIEVKGKGIGIDKNVKEEVTIPPLGAFFPISVRALYQPENGVEVHFSEPLLPDQNVRGLITLTGVGSSYVYQVEDNYVRVFFEGRPGKDVGVYINEGIKSASGLVTERDELHTVSFASLPPMVGFPFPGSILPDSKKLIVPFKTVNLSAVDIRIIRIFENNILSFLQSNTLNTTYELRRYGRLVQKKTILLNRETDIQQDIWYDFSIDLSTMIHQEPGAIYHIELSFQQAYSLYPGANSSLSRGGARNAEPDRRGMISLGSDATSEREQAFWDEAESYYYGYNEVDWSQYAWDEADDPSKPSYYMSRGRNASCNVISSNIGVIAKGGAQNKLWVAVSDITTVKPVKDAEIVVYNYQLQQIGRANTDAQGFAEIEPEGKPFILTAGVQGQTTYLRIADGEEKSLSRFDVDGKEVQRGLKGYIYGERGVWRPGDSLFLSFVLEDRQQRLPASHPVTFELYNPHGQFYHKEISTEGMNGFYTFKIATSEDDPTGLWSAYVKVGGSSFHKPLRIESIKPNRLKVNISIPNNRIEASQGEIHSTLSAAWLTGAVARDLHARVEMHLSSLASPFQGFEQYIFHNPLTDFTSDQFELFDGVLDGYGGAIMDFEAPCLHSAPGMLRATMVCRVFEPGGDASIVSQSVPFSPFDTYVGLNLNQKKGEWLETDIPYSFDVVTLNSLGALTQAGDLEYQIYRLDWSWWWEYGSESYSSYVNNRAHTPEKSGTVSMINGKGAVPFTIDYPSWGRYLIYVKDPEGGHATGGVVYVDWPSWRGRANASDPTAITMLSFSTDKNSYEVGEKVTVMIPHATSGKALVALENGSSVLSRSWVDIASGGNTRYTFKVTEEMAPNIYIHVSLLQPHAQTANDLPIRMYGVIPILVENKDAHLFPKIEMPDVLRPERPFTVAVSEQNGRPMTYTLAIVDDGLLDLTNFKTPDPRTEFYAREAIGVRTWDIYDQVVGAFGQKFGALFSIGGDETLSSSGQRANRFKPVVKFLGPFTLKKGQKEHHTIALPPYVGSVRVMVVSGAPGAYGSVEKTVPVRSPLMLIASLPRVLSIGEEIMLPVNVFAVEEGVTDVHVGVEVSDKLHILGPSFQSLHFNRISETLCYFKLRADNLTGAAKVKITASGNGHSASETIEIELRNPNPPLVMAQEQVVEAGKETTFTYNLAQSDEEVSVTLEISRIPSVDLKRRFDWLENYGHSCTEQLVSKGFPWLYVEQLKEVDEEVTKMIKTNVTEAIKYLYGRQLPNGGFVYWPGQSDANEWITSFAGNFLCVAKEKGYEVNDGVLNRWKNYQQKVTRSWTPQMGNDGQSDLVQAYRLYTLSLAGASETGAMNRLREQKELSPQAKWRLAAAYALEGKANIANDLIRNTSAFIDSYATNRYTYGSSLRDEAMILETMVLLNDMSSALAQARTISQKLSNAYWFDTQSTAFALVAMGALADKAGRGEINVSWSHHGEGQKAIVSAKPIAQIDLPPSSLHPSGDITLNHRGSGELFVRLISKSRPLVDLSPAIANNLSIEVAYTYLNGLPIKPDTLQQGTDFIAWVTVSNIGGFDYTDLALTHIIPSGWEIFNERMVLDWEEDSDSVFTYQDIRDDRVLTYFDLPYNRSKTIKVRLNASYAGRYILPAISCEAMYDTQAQARTTAGWVSVERL